MRRIFAIFLTLLWAGAAFGQNPPLTQCVSSAVAGGTGDALTIPQLPCTATSTLLMLTLTATNSTTSPTLQQIGVSAAQVILNAAGGSVAAGTLQSGNRVLLSYNGTNWFMLTNPAGLGSLAIAGIPPFNSSQYDLGTVLANGLSPTTEYSSQNGGLFATEAFASGVSIPSSMSSSVHQVNAISGYIHTNQTVANASSGGVVGGYFLAVADATSNHANIFGINPVAICAHGASNCHLQNEFDFNPSNSTDVVTGLAAILADTTAAPALATAFAVEIVPGGFNWGFGYGTNDGAAQVAFQVGAASVAGPSVASQPIKFTAYDSGSTQRIASITEDALGNVLIRDGKAGAGVVLQDQGGNILNANTGVVTLGTNVGLTFTTIPVTGTESQCLAITAAGVVLAKTSGTC